MRASLREDIEDTKIKAEGGNDREGHQDESGDCEEIDSFAHSPEFLDQRGLPASVAARGIADLIQAIFDTNERDASFDEQSADFALLELDPGKAVLDGREIDGRLRRSSGRLDFRVWDCGFGARRWGRGLDWRLACGGAGKDWAGRGRTGGGLAGKDSGSARLGWARRGWQ